MQKAAESIIRAINYRLTNIWSIIEDGRSFIATLERGIEESIT